MPPIRPGETITTEDPRIEITPTPDEPLPEGSYTFELVVEDDQERKSPPVAVKVLVQRTRPEAVLEGPEEAELGLPFKLNGEGSTAVEPARLAKFHWRRVPAEE